MEWLWLATAGGWALALVALAGSRRTARQLAQLTEQYWALKYEHGELKARVRALAPTDEERALERPQVQQTFVPLASIKRSS